MTTTARPTPRDRRFVALLLDQMATWQQESGETWSTQALQDFIDSMLGDYDGLYVDMVVQAAEEAEDEYVDKPRLGWGP